MTRHIVAVTLLTGLVLSATWVSSAQVVRPGSCLHGPSERAAQRTRREQALKMAEDINRAEGSGFGLPRSRRYRPLDQLPGVPPAPDGFRVQFHTDGPTYMFSLKDTFDPCGYAIFSDQDHAMYQAEGVRARARVVPADIP